ncbi:hypothetical protein SUGI_1007090 [Cryptomeria japonica]|nr:hypothetical protein SUGI_1007090 [Cryptomeria japonica]
MKCTVQDGERKCLLEENSDAESLVHQVRHKSMEGEKNKENFKIDIQDGETEGLLGRIGQAELWIDQVQRMHGSGKHNERKMSADVSIYRVPKSIKKTKREAYDPLVVFLGPYHHKKHQQLTAIDEYKLQAVDKTLERMDDMTIEGLISKVKLMGQEIRNCYEDSAIEWDQDTLAWMMTMDACFILRFLGMELPNSCLIKRDEIILDILKLENQIPFCILEMILELEFKDSAEVENFLVKLLFSCNNGYFKGYPFAIRYEEKDIKEHIKSGPLHLLDLSRLVLAKFLSSCEHAITVKRPARIAHRSASCVGCFSWTGEDESLIPSAEKLQKAGIRLKQCSGGVHFKRRRFRSLFCLPEIIVEDNTEIFLRNLLAFEECQWGRDCLVERKICFYMCIMDDLIDSKEDVELFRRANIIKNYLGTDDEVAQIFNDLCSGITGKEDFKEPLRNVNDYYKRNQLTVWIHEFWEEHCSKPWYIISFVVGILILVMTLLQTIYTIKK